MSSVKSLEQSGAMQAGTCRRCGGLMVPCFTNSLFLEVAEAVRDPSWRCVNCGEWLDEKILSNRLRKRHADSIPTKAARPFPTKAARPFHERSWKR